MSDDRRFLLSEMANQAQNVVDQFIDFILADAGRFIRPVVTAQIRRDDRKIVAQSVELMPPRMPEFGKKCIENTKHVCNAGAQSHKRIHVGRTMFGLLPGIDKELPAEHQNNRGGNRKSQRK